MRATEFRPCRAECAFVYVHTAAIASALLRGADFCSSFDFRSVPAAPKVRPPAVGGLAAVLRACAPQPRAEKLLFGGGQRLIVPMKDATIEKAGKINRFAKAVGIDEMLTAS